MDQLQAERYGVLLTNVFEIVREMHSEEGQALSLKVVNTIFVRELEDCEDLVERKCVCLYEKAETICMVRAYRGDKSARELTTGEFWGKVPAVGASCLPENP